MAINNFLGYDTGDTGLLPDGQYVVKIDEAQYKNTQKGGKMMYCRFIVVEGEKEGYEAEKRYNLHNANFRVQRQDRAEFAQLLEALNVPDPQCESSICNVRLVIDVRTVADSYGIRNEPIAYHRYEFNQTTGQDNFQQQDQRPWG